MHYSPYITALGENTKTCPLKPAYKLPILQGERTIIAWRTITFDQLYAETDIIAKYWVRTLRLPFKSVVGLWISGLPFSDLLHILGIMRAGYIPHLLNSELTNTDTARTLFKATSASAIIYDLCLSKFISQISNDFSCYSASDAEEIEETEEEDSSVLLPGFDTICNVGDIVAIVHTSGSTSGRPKPVRLSRGWFEVNMHKKPVVKGNLIFPRMGSFCHSAQLGFCLAYFMQETCIVLLPWINYTAEEIIQMHKECNLTVFVQPAPLFSQTIQLAQSNSQLLEVLQSYPIVLYLGGALNKTEIEWCMNNRIALMTFLAITEVGILMESDPNDPLSLFLLKFPGCFYAMSPIDELGNIESSQSRLLELIVLSDSLDCPDESLRDPSDGDFHTRDLFEQTILGVFEYRGRRDDKIKAGNAKLCDTRSIEEGVYAVCGDLVSTCVVVGVNRPLPALLVEPVEPATTEIDKQKLIRRISEKTVSLNEGGYPHERISADRVLIVEKGSMVRTSFKQNVNPAATEIKFKNDLDKLYGTEWINSAYTSRPPDSEDGELPRTT